MANEWTYGSNIDLTNGGADDLTAATILSGLSSDITIIHIMFNSLTFSGSNQAPAIQIGDSGGIETSGYDSACANTTTAQNKTEAYLLYPNSTFDTGNVGAGMVEIFRYGDDTDIWHAQYNGIEMDAAHPRSGHGTKELSGNLTQVAITSTTGVVTFTGGEAIGRYY